MELLSKLKACTAVLGAALAISVMAPKPAAAQSQPFIGQLMLFGGNFCPRDWAYADGSLQSIASNNALFSIVGTMYGGDGRTTFGLPDMRGRAAINRGQGPGLADYRIGQLGGAESLTMTINNMPSHSHAVRSTRQTADKAGPGTDFLAVPDDGKNIYHNGPLLPNDNVMDPAMIANTGGSQSISKRSPYIAMSWCIALYGIYPSRS